MCGSNARSCSFGVPASVTNHRSAPAARFCVAIARDCRNPSRRRVVIIAISMSSMCVYSFSNSGFMSLVPFEVFSLSGSSEARRPRLSRRPPRSRLGQTALVGGIRAELLDEFVVEPEDEQRRRPLPDEHAPLLVAHHLERGRRRDRRHRGPQEGVRGKLCGLVLDGLGDFAFGMLETCWRNGHVLSSGEWTYTTGAARGIPEQVVFLWLTIATRSIASVKRSAAERLCLSPSSPPARSRFCRRSCGSRAARMSRSRPNRALRARAPRLRRSASASPRARR